MSARFLSKTLMAAVALSALGAVHTLPAAAQSGTTEEVVDQRGQSVRDRVRPGYDAVGVRAGSFMIYPQASVTGSYNDNIYATNTGEVDDFVTTLAARVSAQSNWSRHSLNLRAGISQSLYADNSDEDRFDWNVGGSGGLDITRDTRISGGLSYAQLHEDRGDPNSVGAAKEPTEYTLLQANAQFDQRFNRVTARVGATYADYDYDDVEPLIPGPIIDQDDRDREQYTQFVRLGYDVSPDTNLYIQGTLNQREYDQKPPVVAINRDSDGYEIVGGSDFRLSNLMQGGVFVGYQEQDYDNPAFPKISGLSYGATVDWFVTPLTTVGFNASATVQETTTAGASGFLQQSVGVSIDHELMRNVILGAGLSFTNDDYEGIARSDDVIRGRLGVDYLLNRNFSVGLGYDYTDRDSSIGGNDYTRNQVGLTLTGKL